LSLEIKGHRWAEGRGGREIDKRRMGTNVWVVARVRCSREDCDSVGEIKSRSVLPVEVLDKRFKQKGWRLDPPVCPECVQQPKEDRMATHMTEAAGLAQAKVFKLLTAQFDDEKGRYLNGYSDARIAQETGCAQTFVANVRKECFGEIKEAPEIAEFRGSLDALEALVSENMATLQRELADLRAKLSRLSK
jgi:hypothetical protein